MSKQQTVGFIGDVSTPVSNQDEDLGSRVTPRNAWGSWGKVIGKYWSASWDKGPLNNQPHISGYLYILGITFFTMTFREEKYTHCPYRSQSRIHKDMGMVSMNIMGPAYQKGVSLLGVSGITLDLLRNSWCGRTFHGGFGQRQCECHSDLAGLTTNSAGLPLDAVDMGG